MLAESGGRALSAVISKFKMFKDIGYSTFTKMYEACVTPVLDYGSGVWGKAKVTHSDLIQNKACRYFLGVHKFTPIPALQAEMGWFPPKYRKYLNMLRLWNRLIDMPNDRLTKQMFHYDYGINQSNWCADVKGIFYLLGTPEIYENKDKCNLDLCIDKMYELFERDYRQNVEKKPKLRTFKTFKQDCKPTDYVKCCMNRQDRSMLARFRCGILQLKIETGRFNQTKLEDRLCEFCHLNEIETEFHFLCICNKYTDLRNVLFEKVHVKHNVFNNLSLEDKFLFMLTNCNHDVAKYIKHAWERRKQLLYK
jgi:hypothetical protein